jgi:hypothetical protein
MPFISSATNNILEQTQMNNTYQVRSVSKQLAEALHAR